MAHHQQYFFDLQQVLIPIMPSGAELNIGNDMQDFYRQEDGHELMPDAEPLPLAYLAPLNILNAQHDDENVGHVGDVDIDGHAPGCDCRDRMNGGFRVGDENSDGSEASHGEEWSSGQETEDQNARRAAAKTGSMRGWSDDRLEKEIAKLRAMESWIVHHLELISKRPSPGETAADAKTSAPLPLDEAVKQAQTRVERLELLVKQQQIRVKLHTAIGTKLTKQKSRLGVASTAHGYDAPTAVTGPFASRLAPAVSAML